MYNDDDGFGRDATRDVKSKASEQPRRLNYTTKDGREKARGGNAQETQTLLRFLGRELLQAVQKGGGEERLQQRR
jgi:hypothetical protein